jgi:hypothetical protein
MYIFIEYSEESKTYKLYDSIKKKTRVSRDVELNEEVCWNWKN